MTGAPLDPDAVREVLALGDLTVQGRISDASNLTLRAVAELDGVAVDCVYKPVRGERPLWDFPDGTLAQREVAAYQVAVAAGWDCVPTTLLRPGPFGAGMVQQWIETAPPLDTEGLDGDEAGDPDGDDTDDGTDDADDGIDDLDTGPGPGELVDLVPEDRIPPGWLPVLRAVDMVGRDIAVVHADVPALAVLAGFDLVVNNADRKGSHVLAAPDGRVLGVDHGLCFHCDDKLRTILWGWAGEPLPDAVQDGLDRLATGLDGELSDRLHELLTVAEVRVFGERVARLRRYPVFRKPPRGRTPIPWPPL
ncbi:SCO1664 family protein [Nakamurella endophytica]|uniref:SCO1664 family protein n=1 Tax=Nakamurella endophytica TaxID=1748367 RepID=UPI00166F628D|nr:SCO1664 family protein [Nakamurella endophytica]